jgi:hypothetical protein
MWCTGRRHQSDIRRRFEEASIRHADDRATERRDKGWYGVKGLWQRLMHCLHYAAALTLKEVPPMALHQI